MMPGSDEAVELSKEPLMVEGVAGVQLVACGSSHSAYVVGGQLHTWGSNKYQQLGHDAPAVAEMPGAISEEDLAGVTQASLGAQHSAAITSSGELFTWGWGGSFFSGAGGLGQGSRDGVQWPTRVERFAELGEKVTAVACGGQHTLALTESGRLWATGKGEYGRLGRGDTRDELDFEEIDYYEEAMDSILEPGVATRIVSIDAGNNFSAALSSSGELWLWGRNDQGQLGLGDEAMGDMYSAERYPRLVRGLPDDGHRITNFACGENHIIVRTDTGHIYEWGGRTWLEPRRVPISSQHEEQLQNVVKLAAGEKYSFALTADGTLFTWGSKSSGCLALGPECAKTVVEPTPISAETFSHQKVVDIVASKGRCLAITDEEQYMS